MENNGSNKNFSQTRLIIVLVSIIVILVFVIGIFVGARLGEKQPINNNPTNKETEKKEESKENKTIDKKEESKEDNTTKKIEELSLNNELVKEADSLIPRYVCGGMDLPLEQKDITLFDLTDAIKAEMLASVFSKDRPNRISDSNYRTNVKFTKDDAKKYFEDSDFLENIDNLEIEYISYKIQKSGNDYYIVFPPSGCEGPGENRDELILANAKKTSEELVLTYKNYYLKSKYNYKTKLMKIF